MTRGKTFDEVALGTSFEAALTVTEEHVTLGARLIGDTNPLHVDDAFAAASRYGTRILHGVMTSAIMGAPVGMAFSGTAIGYLEHNCRFLAPVRIGDSLATRWVVTGLEPKPWHDGGVVTLEGECANQRGEIVARAVGRMLVGNKPGAR